MTKEEQIAKLLGEAEERTKTACLPIEQLLKEGKEEEAASIISLCDNFGHQAQKALLLYADCFKNPVILYDLIIDVYTDDGYDFPRRLIIKAKKLAKEIPETHRLKDFPISDNTVTIWRGTNVINPDAEYELRRAVSWTTDKSVAFWFANRFVCPYSSNGKGAVWEGTIERGKIIAFTQDRNESEVLQHMDVKNPHILNPTQEEYDAEVQKRVKANKH